MSECCGKNLKTHYCPMCGKPNVVVEDAQSLLRYLKGQLAKSEAWGKRAPGNKNVARNIHKWCVWIDWVEHAIDKKLQ